MYQFGKFTRNVTGMAVAAGLCGLTATATMVSDVADGLAS